MTPTLLEVGVFSYSGYFMLKGHSMAIQWPLGSALTVGLVQRQLDGIVESLRPFSIFVLAFGTSVSELVKYPDVWGLLMA